MHPLADSNRCDWCGRPQLWVTALLVAARAVPDFGGRERVQLGRVPQPSQPMPMWRRTHLGVESPQCGQPTDHKRHGQRPGSAHDTKSQPQHQGQLGAAAV